MSQFKPTRGETATAKYIAKECEHNVRLALMAVNKYDRIYWLKKAGVYSAEAFALSRHVAARSRP